MIEFLIGNVFVILNIYIIGYTISVVLMYILAGYSGDRTSDILIDSLGWFLDVIYLIGLGFAFIEEQWKKRRENKQKNKGQK